MDIIRRLRLLGQSASLGKASCKSIGEEAAAEIERLTAENERLRAALTESARLLNLEQLQGLSEKSVHALRDIGLLVDQQETVNSRDLKNG